MQHLHKFEPHPELTVLFCSRCGETKEIGAAPEPPARASTPRRPRTRRQQNAADAAEAELARRVMELPLGENIDEEIANLVEQERVRREAEKIPVVDDDRIGAGTGL